MVAVLLAICLWPGRNQSATWWKVAQAACRQCASYCIPQCAQPCIALQMTVCFHACQICLQVVALTDVYVGRGKWRVRLRLPALNDAKLLLAALVWPPSCFVSDATAKTGARARPDGCDVLAVRLGFHESGQSNRSLTGCGQQIGVCAPTLLCCCCGLGPAQGSMFASLFSATFGILLMQAACLVTVACGGSRCVLVAGAHGHHGAAAVLEHHAALRAAALPAVHGRGAGGDGRHVRRHLERDAGMGAALHAGAAAKLVMALSHSQPEQHHVVARAGSRYVLQRVVLQLGMVQEF